MAQSEIDRYSEVAKTMTAVKLPEKQEHGRINKTYPPFILDAASGVGKTQQAFALLHKNSRGLVYCHNQPIGNRAQEIYREMNSRLDLGNFLKLVNDALKELENYKSKENDPFSVAALEQVLQFQDVEHQYPGLAALIQGIGRRINNGDGVEDPKPEDRKRKFNWLDEASPNIEEAIEKIKDAILFIDEALPRSQSSNNMARTDAINRLRFMRNLGRAAGMRVVLAGTAATIANIICDYSDGGAQSRIEGNTEICWAVCEFFWLSAEESSVSWCEDAALRNLLLSGRPLVARELRSLKDYLEAEGGLMGALEELGHSLVVQKSPPEAAWLDWLSGAWLDGKTTPPSPYLMKPTELVQHHFFEPAIAVSSSPKSKEVSPHLGVGLVSVGRVSGPCRVFVDHARGSEKETVWWVLTTADTSCTVRPKSVGPHNASICKGFGGVEYALSHCVQQCLVREPLLATALSFRGSKIGAGDLHRLIADCWYETKNQRTVGAIDGEMNEAFCFIVLQLAANYKRRNGDKKNAMTFIGDIYNFMKLQKHDDYEDMARTFGFQEPGPNSQDLTWNYCRPGDAKKDEKVETATPEAKLKAKLKSVPIPRLVPACSEEDLRNKIAQHPTLFGNDAIAGLIPGPTLSLLDAKMMVWQEKAPISWKFEFKSRSGPYTSANGRKDLEEKIGDDVERFETQFAELTEQKDKGSQKEQEKRCKMLKKLEIITERKKEERACHAMLLAVKSSGEPTAHIWSIMVKNEEYLRVVLVLNCSGL